MGYYSKEFAGFVIEKRIVQIKILRALKDNEIRDMSFEIVNLIFTKYTLFVSFLFSTVIFLPILTNYLAKRSKIIPIYR